MGSITPLSPRARTATALAAFALAPLAATAAPLPVEKIIDTQTPGVHPFAFIQATDSAINNEGQIAYKIQIDEFDYAILTGKDPLNDRFVTSYDDEFTGFTDLALADSGAIAFRAGMRNSQRRYGTLQRGNINSGIQSLTRLATFNDGVSPWQDVGAPEINSQGQAVFGVLYTDGTEAIARGPNPATDIIVDTNGPFAGLGTSPVINNSGQIAFQGRLDTGAYGIFTGPDPQTDTFITGGADPVNPLAVPREPIITNRGDIFLQYRWTDDTGDTHSVFATGPDVRGVDQVAAGHLNYGEGEYGLFSWAARDMNDHGDFVFVADALVNGEFITGLFIGPDPYTDCILRFGDELFGGTVVGVSFSDQSYNDDGQLLFDYVLDNGVRGLAIMTIPEPSAAALPAVMLALARRRRG